ncbi:hypothetical protein CI109_106227 [Kwoniella shandongensis]|uniref:Uncharacterized protein n=1 Tax=Kwoniella shandongensis TaxID=1734106 RepID=A0A5M6C3U7_9TREE|nr:uncharacterized protein CI109_003831 [Kwoniella shandongensis]KAA5527859.1 hypothetical protein CI109_003831 [Kwoniella shandongensis]
MCCEAEWKREVVPDHKFDFINVREFHKTDIWTRIKYIFRYVWLLKSIVVYGLDIFTAATMIVSDHWTNSLTAKCDYGCAVDVKYSIAKWVFVGCIIFSFLLLAYETYRAKKVVDSRDISYAFTNLIANDYYSFRSYDNFCLFCQIESSSKKKDDFAFFVFFTFKEWKRLILADGPRQSINALLLYSFGKANNFQTSDIPAYWDNSAVTAMLLFSMIFTVLIFLGSMVLLIVAAVCYIPLLCYIQGNLKEYVCHKVDKRITELIKKNTRQRIARAAAMEKKMANGAMTKSDYAQTSLGLVPQPTLPQVMLDDDEDMRMRTARTKARQAGKEMPSSDFASFKDAEAGYASQPSAGYEYRPPGEYPVYQNYSDEFNSSTNLTANAAPLGISYPPPVAPAPPIPSYSYSSAPTQPSFPPSRSHSDFQHYGASGRTSPYAAPQYEYDYRRDSEASGLAYDRNDGSGYYSSAGQDVGRGGWR